MSWKVKSLQDVCEKITDGTHQTPTYFPDGIVFLSSKNVTTGKIDWESIKYIDEAQHLELHKRVAPKIGDILLAKNGTTGVAAIVDRDIVFDIYVSLAWLRPKGEITSEYLLQFINSPLAKKQFNSRLKGIGVPNLHLKEIKEVKIPIPPLSEQQAIVKKLDAAFALIDQAKANIEKNIQNAKELFQSKLNQIFSQKGEGWEERKLGEIGKVCMCKRIMKHQTDPDGEIPFYKIGTFGKAADAFISNEIYLDFKKKYSYPKKGEILISASGTIGRRVIFDGEAAYFQDSNIVWIQNDESKVLNNYLYHFYSVCDWNPSKGATISRLYNDDLRKISISFPTIDKQNDLIPIIEKLSQQTNLLQEKYRQKLQNLEELRKSILEKAFKGELVQMSESQISSD